MAPNPALGLIPDGRKSLRAGAVVAWPLDFATNFAFARLIECLPGSGGIDLDTRFDDLAGPGTGARSPTTALTTPGSPSPPPVASPRSRSSTRVCSRRSRKRGVSFMYRYKLQGMVDDVPCASCMGAAGA